VKTPAYFGSHPTISGISLSFDSKAISGSGIIRPFQNATLYGDSYRVLDWADGSPLIAVRDFVGPSKGSRVDMGFWPLPAEDNGPNSWNASTADAAGLGYRDLTIAALQYVLGNTAYLCALTTSTSCATVPDFNTELQNDPDFLAGYTVTGQTPAAGASLASGQTEAVNFTVTSPAGGSLFCSLDLTGACSASAALSSPFSSLVEFASSLF